MQNAEAFWLRSELWSQPVHVYKVIQIWRSHLLTWKKRILFLFFVYFEFLPTWPDWVNRQWSNIIHLTPNLHFQYVLSIKSLINNKKHVPCPKIKKLVKTIWNADSAVSNFTGIIRLCPGVTWNKDMVDKNKYYFMVRMNFESGHNIFDKMLTRPRAIWRAETKTADGWCPIETVSYNLIFNQGFEI